MIYHTLFDQKILTNKPKKMSICLPSRFQIGDDVEFILDELTIINAVIQSVKFSGSGTVSYDIAVCIEGNEIYTVIKNIRGHIRAKGSYESEDDLSLISLEEITPYIKRDLFHIVK